MDLRRLSTSVMETSVSSCLDPVATPELVLMVMAAEEESKPRDTKLSVAGA
jgi:predicted Na+-dependent transporter